MIYWLKYQFCRSWTIHTCRTGRNGFKSKSTSWTSSKNHSTMRLGSYK